MRVGASAHIARKGRAVARGPGLDALGHAAREELDEISRRAARFRVQPEAQCDVVRERHELGCWCRHGGPHPCVVRTLNLTRRVRILFGWLGTQLAQQRIVKLVGPVGHADCRRRGSTHAVVARRSDAAQRREGPQRCEHAGAPRPAVESKLVSDEGCKKKMCDRRHEVGMRPLLDFGARRGPGVHTARVERCCQ